jgi:hypothetical protein
MSSLSFLSNLMRSAKGFPFHEHLYVLLVYNFSPQILQTFLVKHLSLLRVQDRVEDYTGSIQTEGYF